MRDLTLAVRTAAQANRVNALSKGHVDDIVFAERRLGRVMASYGQEREDVANTATTVAVVAATALTLGSGLTAAVMLRAVAASGAATVVAKAGALGPSYSAEHATYDFLLAAGMEAGGLGSLKAVHAAAGGLRTGAFANQFAGVRAGLTTFTRPAGTPDADQ